MVAKVMTAAPIGFDGALIEVESDAKAGLPGMQIVGMGNKSIDEARERVRSAIRNSMLDFPRQKVTINLAPAELPKDGTFFDLPIALAVLVSSGQLLQTEVDRALFAGELALDGQLRTIRGAINIAQVARQKGATTVYLPLGNAAQACLVEGLTVIGVRSLKELFLHLKGVQTVIPFTEQIAPMESPTPPLLLDDILGQEQAKRALAIAAAGHHNLLLSGPPGTGKTMLARALVGLLPPLSLVEQLAVTKLHSLANQIGDEVIQQRPFRSPHHTASTIALLGGGAKAQPGEISLAHYGVLLLDELPEFPRSTIEALRQPLEDRRIALARSHTRVTYPADFILVATANPCPCGYLGDAVHPCHCSQMSIQSYQRKLSGPLLDRIDLHLSVGRTLQGNQSLSTVFIQSSMRQTQQSKVLDAVENAVEHQKRRYSSSAIYNGNVAHITPLGLMNATSEALTLLDQAARRLELSSRGYSKVLRVARTIADLDNDSLDEDASILPRHVAEALQFRPRTTTPT